MLFNKLSLWTERWWCLSLKLKFILVGFSGFVALCMIMCFLSLIEIYSCYSDIYINICLHLLLLIIFLSFILIIRKYYLKEKPTNIFVLIAITFIFRYISIYFKSLFVNYYVYIIIFFVLLLILIFIYLIYKYVLKKEQFNKNSLFIKIHNSLIIITFWILISLVSILLDYNFFALDFLTIYIAINFIKNEIINYLSNLSYNSISSLLDNAKNFICNINIAFNPKKYIRSNRSFLLENLNIHYIHQLRTRGYIYIVDSKTNNNFKIKHVNLELKLGTKCDTSQNYVLKLFKLMPKFDRSEDYVIKLVNNSLISIDNVLIKNEIVSPINLSINEKPNIFAKYGGPNNPMFVHKDVYLKVSGGDPNDFGAPREWNKRIPLDIENLIDNQLTVHKSKNILDNISNNYPALIDYIKMSRLQKEKHYIMLPLNNKLVALNKESDELKKILFYSKFNEVYEFSYWFNPQVSGESSFDDMIKWNYFAWINFTRELNTINKVLLYHNNKDIKLLPYYNEWLKRQVTGFMEKDLSELSKKKPDFNNLNIRRLHMQRHYNMFDNSIFMEETIENRAYVRLRVLFHTILLEEAKKNIKNFNKEEFVDNVLLKYHDIIYKTEDLRTFSNINEKRHNDYFNYAGRLDYYAAYKNINIKMLNHRGNLRPGIVGLSLSSKHFFPVLWGDGAKMEYIIKRKLN